MYTFSRLLLSRYATYLLRLCRGKHSKHTIHLIITTACPSEENCSCRTFIWNEFSHEVLHNTKKMLRKNFYLYAGNHNYFFFVILFFIIYIAFIGDIFRIMF